MSLASVGLAACGGGSTVAVESVPFDGAVTSADYIGKSFPVFFLVGEGGDPSGSAIAGRGSITYNDDDSVTVSLPGASPIRLARSGSTGLGTRYTGSGLNPVTAVVTGFSSTTAFRVVSSTDDDFALLGGFGFETQPGDRGASATYSTAGAVFLTTPDAENFLPVAGDGTLNANFANGTISGTLLSTDPISIQLAGDSNTPDDLAMLFMLEGGRINSDGFSGGVTLSAELVVDGSGSPLDLNANIARDSAEGAFFGEQAAAVAGIFEGDVSLADGSTPLVEFDASGFVSGSKTGP